MPFSSRKGMCQHMSKFERFVLLSNSDVGDILQYDQTKKRLTLMCSTGDGSMETLLSHLCLL